MNIRIGAFDYSIEYVKDLQGDLGKADGHIEYDNLKIAIEKDMNHQVQAQTLLHEVLHGICVYTGLKLKEQEIDILAHGIYQVMRDNPELVRMITE